MKKKSIFLDWLKIFLLSAIFFLLSMLYWSSHLIEKQLIDLKKKFVELETFSYPHQAKVYDELGYSTKDDPNLPNLLEEDLFYTKTLPHLLPSNYHPFPLNFSPTISKPHSLNPFEGWQQVADWIQKCIGTAAVTPVGKQNGLSPGLAWKIEERMDKKGRGTEYWVHLRKGLTWSSLPKGCFPSSLTFSPHFDRKHPVTAYDFKFAFDLTMNPFNQKPRALAYRGIYRDIEEVKVIDPYTFVVRWYHKPFEQSDGTVVYKPKYVSRLYTASFFPLPTWLYPYNPDGTKIIDDQGDPDFYRNSSAFIQQFETHWAQNIIPSCGAWTFVNFTDEALHLKRNRSYFEPLAALYDEIEVSFRNGQESIWNDFKVGKTSIHSLDPQQLSDWETFKGSSAYREQEKNGEKISVLTYLPASYSSVGWNIKRPLFESKKVRQALTLAINRKVIIEQLLGGQGVEIRGPLTEANTDQNLPFWPYDPDRAKKLLAEEGFVDLDGDGILEKEIEGRKVLFSFKLLYFVKSSLLKSITEAISSQLQKVGIRCEPLGLDITDLSERMNSKNFDSTIISWQLGTGPEDPRQLWHSKGALEQGSSNLVGFEKEEVDGIIESLDYEDDPLKRLELYHKFCRIIYDEQPYTFLARPKRTLLYRNYLENVFIPEERQDLIPGADVTEPDSTIFWDKRAF